MALEITSVTETPSDESRVSLDDANTIECSIENGIAVITLNRPDSLNALNAELVDDLRRVLQTIDADRKVRMVVLTGAGRGFCSGLDLANPGNLSRTEGLDRVEATLAGQQQIVALVPLIRSVRQPVIAAVNGPAAGAGFALALAADVRFAAPTASFVNAFINVGLSGCDFGVSFLLPRLIGLSRATEIMMTGRKVSAEEALAIGLVHAIDEEDVIGAAVGFSELLLGKSPYGLEMTKQVLFLNAGATSLQQAMELENRTQVMATFTGDMAEAIKAFSERRPPQFGKR